MIVRALIDHGVQHLFGYPGGAVLPIYDEIFQQSEVEHILVRHEQGAGHAAEGYARSTGKPGVVLVTSGPGATNMVTPLTDALMDSIPLVCITGPVSDASDRQRRVPGMRHRRHHASLHQAQLAGARRQRSGQGAARGILCRYLRPSRSGSGGHLPKDVQFAVGASHPPRKSDVHVSYTPRVKGDAAQIRKAVALLASAKRPVIYSGGGVINAGPEASKLLRDLVEATGFPITSTLMGLGAYPASGKNWLGMLGMHGTYEANMAMHDCDVMLCIGARFDDRITGRVDTFFAGLEENPHRHRSVLDQQEHPRRRADHRRRRQRDGRPAAGVQGGIEEAGHQGLVAGNRGVARAQFGAPKKNNDIILPQYAIERLFAATRGRDTYITTEVGQHQMWAAQFFGFEEPHRWMTSGGLGTMGYGLPAALGVQVAHPDSLVIDIAGDASVQMTMQEMSTAVQYELPIKIFILNNQYMGMVRQWQQLLHGNRLSHSYSEALPDFVKLADAFGCVRPAGDQARRSRRRAQGNDQRQASGAVRLQFAALRKLFPDNSSGKAHNEMLLPVEATDEATAAAFAGGKALV